MNDLKIFNYNGNEVRTVQKDGEPWWVLRDVCAVLEMDTSQVGKVANRLEEDERKLTTVTDSLGRQQSTYIINESGLYNVILRSDKPEAKPFRKWVTSEVLPSIRKHGAYMTEQVLEQALASPDFLIKLATQLKEEKDKNKELEVKNSQLVVDKQIMQPKADYFDELVDRNLLTNFRETAKQLDIPPKKFVAFLVDKKYVYRDKRGKLLPYEDKNKGLFEVKETFNEKTQWSGTQTLIKPKGRETFRLLYLNSIA